MTNKHKNCGLLLPQSGKLDYLVAVIIHGDGAKLFNRNLILNHFTLLRYLGNVDLNWLKPCAKE